MSNWITEELIGTKNGTNTSFSVSQAPNVSSMSVFFNGFRLIRVVGSPQSGEGQYGVSGTTVIVGTAPAASGQWLQTRYWHL